MPTDWRTHFQNLSGGASFGGDPSFGVDASTTRAVQAALNAQGIQPPLAVDGQWGPNTEAAVRTFQTAHGLVVDGVPGPQTLGALGVPVPPPTASTGQTVLPNKSTPMGPEDVYKALASGYKKVTGNAPTLEVLNLIAAQSAFETGGWGAGIHNYNFGNAKATAHDPYVQIFNADEVVNGKRVFSDMKFAAFLNPTDAGVHQINLLKSRQNWWDGLHSGSAEGFVKGLSSAPAYFTANPDQYRAGLERYATKYLDLAAKYASAANVAMLGGVAVYIGLGLATAVGISLYKAWKGHG
jgi:peptidoglycan hydrolase-like protein with peptidoglycan-binding domain